LYDQPHTRFVADFIGDSNVFEGVLTDSGDRMEWKDLSLRVPAAPDGGGRRAALVLRPHHLHLTSEPGSWDNTLAARIVDIAFLGASQKLELELETGGPLVVRRSAHDVQGEAVGDRVTVGWSAGAGIVLQDSSEAADERVAELADPGQPRAAATTTGSKG
jgi:ABC-type Fe3+/spermidine/putrescine transport system ATPase subunit